MDLIQLKLLGFAFWLVFWAVVLGPMIGVSWLLDRGDRRRAEAARRAAGPTPAAAQGKAA